MSIYSRHIEWGIRAPNPLGESRGNMETTSILNSGVYAISTAGVASADSYSYKEPRVVTGSVTCVKPYHDHIVV